MLFKVFKNLLLHFGDQSHGDLNHWFLNSLTQLSLFLVWNNTIIPTKQKRKKDTVILHSLSSNSSPKLDHQLTNEQTQITSKQIAPLPSGYAQLAPSLKSTDLGQLEIRMHKPPIHLSGLTCTNLDVLLCAE